MLKRYPHIAEIKIITESNNGTSTPTLIHNTIEVEGRYEPLGQNKALDYSAKFYCNKIYTIKNMQRRLLEPFELDGQPFVFQGKQLKIAQIFNYQSHCEIWLE